MRKDEIGRALDSMENDVKTRVTSLAAQYRKFGLVAVLKQAVDTPQRARAQVQAWIQKYDAAHGAGTAVTYLNSCLVAAGSSKTVAQINSALLAMANQAQTLVVAQQGGATWDEIATQLEALVVPDEEMDFTYAQLPIPEGYVTCWGEPW